MVWTLKFGGFESHTTCIKVFHEVFLYCPLWSFDRRVDICGPNVYQEARPPKKQKKRQIHCTIKIPYKHGYFLCLRLLELGLWKYSGRRPPLLASCHAYQRLREATAKRILSSDDLTRNIKITCPHKFPCMPAMNMNRTAFYGEVPRIAGIIC